MTDLVLECFENGIRIYQNKNLYKFTSDSIKLAKFCKIKSNDNILDMCAGCGVVGFYAYSLTACNKIYFNELQPVMCDLIERNIELNNMSEKCKVLCKNLNDLTLSDFDKPLDVIMCNPPYFKPNSKIKQNEHIAISRHEITTDLKCIISKAGTLIKSGGKFYLILPASRLCEAVLLLGANKFEVKEIETYYSNNVATVCVLESVKCGKAGVKIKLLKEGV